MEIIRKFVFSLFLILPITLMAGEAVNINTANQETLMTVKGIGEKRAAAIIAHREEHGSFKSIEALAEVSDIGDSLVEKNRDSLTVNTME